MNITNISGIVLLTLSYTIDAQIVKLKPNADFQEVWHKNIPISGGLKVGAMFSVNNISTVQRTFFVKLPAGKYNHLLCVKVNSLDGRFFGSVSYNIKLDQGGLIELEWPTKKWNELKSYTTDKLAILAIFGKACNNEEEIIVPASWNKADMADTLTFAVNSDKFPKIEVYNVKTKKKKDYKCTSIQGNHKTAYKCLCEVPIHELPDTYEMNIIHKVQSGASFSFKSFPVFLKL